MNDDELLNETARELYNSNKQSGHKKIPSLKGIAEKESIKYIKKMLIKLRERWEKESVKPDDLKVLEKGKKIIK